MVKQQTLSKKLQIIGIGVHTGEKIKLTLHPAAIDQGIVFCRTDLANPVMIPAITENVGDTTLSTALTKDDVRISTIEHLMAALAGLRIDNVYIEVDAQEIPIMDGSSAVFVAKILAAGIEEQNTAKKVIKIKKKIEVSENDKTAVLEPFDGMKFTFTIDYDHPVFHKYPNTVTIDLAKASFSEEISKARTFGFVKEVDYLRSKNLAFGASLENTIAIDNNKIINEDGLRYQDEFVKHKILDALGDLYLLGHNIVGSFTGYKSGHSLNDKLVKKLLATQDVWELITL
jgi:UDP-3-O-[3-hydroxymyristoyl] N-acetylglucosamine deacetylase